MKKTKDFIFDKPLVIFDVETSGVSENASIIQLGATVMSKSGEIDIADGYSCYIKPYTEEWSYDAFNIHQIDKEFLYAAGLNINEALSEFVLYVKEKTRGKCYLAQWSCGFDTSMLQRAFKSASKEYPYSYRSFDIASVVRFHLGINGFNTNKGLHDCARLLGINTAKFKAHDALSDAQLTALTLSTLIHTMKVLYDEKKYNQENIISK
jgi:DNA polymerase III epsilon subunit-like protein